MYGVSATVHAYFRKNTMHEAFECISHITIINNYGVIFHVIFCELQMYCDRRFVSAGLCKMRVWLFVW